MANEEQLAILKQGVKVWNDWRESSLDTKPDLSGADLHRANLRGVNFERAPLSRANLIVSNLRWANLRGTELVGVDLSPTVAVALPHLVARAEQIVREWQSNA